MQKLLPLLILLIPLITKAADQSVLINEICWMGTEVSSNDEWLELYNSTESEVDLTGWRLEAEDGSPQIQLSGIIPAGGYFLLERTDDETVLAITADQIYSGSLGNTGEWLKLYDSQNNLIDELNASESWPGGNNTSKQTLERSGLDNWQTSKDAFGTPKAANSQGSVVLEEETEQNTSTDSASEDDTVQEASQPNVAKGSVIFNEIFPNPKGTDENEFIELKNKSQSRIDITGWKIANINKQNFILPSIIMSPESIVVFFRKETGLILNNNKDKLTLYSKAGKIIDEASYKLEAPEEKSYQKDDGNNWQWFISSPGQVNLAKEEILPTPVINGQKTGIVGQIITFDASDSFDSLNRKLNFTWDFGDGRIDKGISVRQIYFKPGNYEVILKAETENHASTTEKLKIKIIGEEPVKKPANDLTATSTPTTTESLIALEEMPFIFLSEFLPNPKGADEEGEFIEIYNEENKPVNISGFQLDDAEGGSKPYTIPENTIIKPGQYLAFFRPQTKIALNNSDESVRLIAPNGTIADLAYYEESKEGQSYVLDEQFNWQKSQTPTPNEINVLDILEQKEDEKSEQKNTGTPKVLGAETAKIIDAGQPKNKSKYIFAGASALVALAVFGISKLKSMKHKS